jgi:cold shock CspA family protein
MKTLLALITFSFAFINNGDCQLNCNLTYLTTIENFDVYTHNQSGAILYRAKFAVDADGCPRAYGPNDTGLDWTANAGYPGNWWGIVTFFNESKGFGFIKDSVSQESIFTHVNDHLDTIKENNKVTFIIEKSFKGLKAVEVKLLR